MSKVHQSVPADSGLAPETRATLAEPSKSSGQNLFDQWSVPSLNSESKEFAQLNSLQQEAFVQNVFESAREQGKQQGYQNGFSEGAQHLHTEIAALMDALQSYKVQLENPLKQLDKTVVSVMVKLAIDLAEQIVRSEINRQPELIAQQLDQALDTLSDISIEVTAKMNPQDVRTVSTVFLEDNSRYQRLNIIEDNSLARGDCCLTTSTSSVESRVRDKLKQMSEQLMVLIEEEGEHE